MNIFKSHLRTLVAPKRYAPRPGLWLEKLKLMPTTPAQKTARPAAYLGRNAQLCGKSVVSVCWRRTSKCRKCTDTSTVSVLSTGQVPNTYRHAVHRYECTVRVNEYS